MAIDEQHVALPKLYGAPAPDRRGDGPLEGQDARPPRLVPGDVEKPFDPDDLPIEVEMTPEERELAATLPAHAYAPGGHSTVKRAPADGAAAPTLQPKPLSLKALAGRILGGDS